MLLIIPVFTIIYSLSLRYSQGPFYYNTGYDPSYVYLISSLNIAQFKSPQHVDHPGTPVQLIGAVILKSVYLLSGKSDDISKDVFENSEKYLKIIFLCFLIFNAAVLFFCGVFLYRITGNILLVILIQLSVFSSYTTSSELASFAPEIFLISLCVLLVSLSFGFISTNRKKKTVYILMVSIICGIGIATKLTFIPLLIIPFLLIKGIFRKMLFLFLIVFVFLISILPAISNYEYFLNWLNGLLMHDGIYGFGNKTILNPDNFFANLFLIFQSEIIFSISFILMSVFLGVIVLRYRQHFIKELSSGYFTLLVSFFLASALQLMIVAKHYSPRYMIPSLILSAPAIYLTVEFFFKIFEFRINGTKKLKINSVLIILITLIISVTAVQFVTKYFYFENIKNEIEHITDIIEKYDSDKITVSSYGSSRMEYALAFAVFYSGEMSSKYQALLFELYPDMYYFDYFNNRIYSYRPEMNGNLFEHTKRILFLNKFPENNQGFKDELRQDYPAEILEFRSLYSASSGETLYEVILK